MTAPAPHKARFIQLVERLTAERLAELKRKHTSCVAAAVGPGALARMLRADRIPEGDTELTQLASKLTNWALGIDPDAERPYADDDLMSSSG